MSRKKSKKKQLPSKPLHDSQQEFFCQLYAGVASKNYFGNATASYLHAYGGEAETYEIMQKLAVIPRLAKQRDEWMPLEQRKKQIYATANACGTRLLVNVHVKARCDYLLDQCLNDDEMDREMAYVMRQRKDLNSKVQAYGQVVKVKNRITEKLQGEIVVSWKDRPVRNKKKVEAIKINEKNPAKRGLAWKKK